MRVKRCGCARSSAESQTRNRACRGSMSSFLRDRDPRALDCLKKRFPIAWAEARCEVVEAELGDADPVLIAEARMRVKGVSPSGVWVLAGGPPCQAYSTAGRSRRKHDPSYAGDLRLRLYKSFMKFVQMLRPPVVVFDGDLVRESRWGVGVCADRARFHVGWV